MCSYGFSQASVPVTSMALNPQLHFTGDTDGEPLSGGGGARTYELEWSIKPEN